MKTAQSTSILLTLTLLVLSSAPVAADPLGTAFTYQGRLASGGQAANGIYDFQFTVFDSPAGTNVLAGPLTNAAVAISNGLFTTTLDFGANVFTSDARWLEIAVSTNGVGAFHTLPPRQPLTPTPYALFAPSAGSATAASSASVAHTALAVTSNAIFSASIASGQVVKSLNGLQDAVALVAGANVILATNGNALQISAAGGGGRQRLGP